MFITNVSGVALPSSSAFGTSGAKTSKSEYQIYIDKSFCWDCGLF